MEDINLHFTGDIHAIGTAHNLCAAVLDNHLFQGNDLKINPHDVSWPRVVDLNDRSLRQITVGQGGEGVERNSRFDITVASEVMAILCLATDIEDLKARLDRIIVGATLWGRKVTAQDLKVSGSMAALLKDAFMPNLVQTLENTPAIIHGGPFANIAHGCNSVQATRMALKLGDYCVTEAGFGADLGAEKFFDIKCRYAGLQPRVSWWPPSGLKMHGGVPFRRSQAGEPARAGPGYRDLKAPRNLQMFGPPVGGDQPLPRDTDAEVALLPSARRLWPNVSSPMSGPRARGRQSTGGRVVRICEGGEKPELNFAYELGMTIPQKIEAIATKIYGADGVDFHYEANAAIERFTRLGYETLPVCMAKTQASLSDDKTKIGRPRDWRLTVREIRLSAGAGMVVPVCGAIMTMPGLPKHPAAENIDLINGEIVGLF